MYEIIVRKSIVKQKIIGKSWEPLARNGDKTEYGYTPEVESITTETIQVYSQVVDDLDLVAVIDAVNKGV